MSKKEETKVTLTKEGNKIMHITINDGEKYSSSTALFGLLGGIYVIIKEQESAGNDKALETVHMALDNLYNGEFNS